MEYLLGIVVESDSGAGIDEKILDGVYRAVLCYWSGSVIQVFHKKQCGIGKE